MSHVQDQGDANNNNDHHNFQKLHCFCIVAQITTSYAEQENIMSQMFYGQ